MNGVAFRKVVVASLICLGFLLANYFLAILWWNLWMSYGFPGATGFFGRFFGLDGEASYDARMFEMWGWLFLLTTILFGFKIRLQRATDCVSIQP